MASGWFDPKQVMASALQGDFPMAPPTWWTLLELSRHPDIEAVIADARTRPILPIQPVMRFDEAGIHLFLPGHPDHPTARIPGLPTHVEFEEGSWVAYDGADRIAFPQMP